MRSNSEENFQPAQICGVYQPKTRTTAILPEFSVYATQPTLLHSDILPIVFHASPGGWVLNQINRRPEIRLSEFKLFLFLPISVMIKKFEVHAHLQMGRLYPERLQFHRDQDD